MRRVLSRRNTSIDRYFLQALVLLNFFILNDDGPAESPTFNQGFTPVNALRI
jgi:hypothetical protein